MPNWSAHKTEPEIYGFEILSPAYRPGPASPVNLGIVKIGGDDHHKIGGAEPLSLDPRALSQAAVRAALSAFSLFFAPFFSLALL